MLIYEFTSQRSAVDLGYYYRLYNDHVSNSLLDSHSQISLVSNKSSLIKKGKELGNMNQDSIPSFPQKCQKIVYDPGEKVSIKSKYDPMTTLELGAKHTA